MTESRFSVISFEWIRYNHFFYLNVIPDYCLAIKRSSFLFHLHVHLFASQNMEFSAPRITTYPREHMFFNMQHRPIPSENDDICGIKGNINLFMFLNIFISIHLFLIYSSKSYGLDWSFDNCWITSLYNPLYITYSNWISECWISQYYIHILKRTATTEENSNSLLYGTFYRMCLQAAIFKPEYNFSMFYLYSVAKKVRDLYETYREIYPRISSDINTLHTSHGSV